MKVEHGKFGKAKLMKCAKLVFILPIGKCKNRCLQKGLTICQCMSANLETAVVTAHPSTRRDIPIRPSLPARLLHEQ